MTTETTESIKRLRDRINSLRSKLAQGSQFDLEGIADEAMEEVLTLETAIRTTPNKNDALIDRVRKALDIDLREYNAIFTPLLTDVLEELNNPGAWATKPQPPAPVLLMEATEETEGDGRFTEEQALEDARKRMEANPLACIATATVKGDRATFKVKDAVEQADEYGFTLSENVGWCSIMAIAKVIMLHITRVFGVTAARMTESDSREGGLIIEFNRELTESEADALETFLGV